MSVMRTLRRGVAHHRMDIAGFVHVNKNPKSVHMDAFGRKYEARDGSMFSHKWRDYLKMTKQAGDFANKKNKRHGHKVA